jgi:hypothetical protein
MGVEASPPPGTTPRASSVRADVTHRLRVRSPTWSGAVVLAIRLAVGAVSPLALTDVPNGDQPDLREGAQRGRQRLPLRCCPDRHGCLLDRIRDRDLPHGRACALARLGRDRARDLGCGPDDRVLRAPRCACLVSNRLRSEADVRRLDYPRPIDWTSAMYVSWASCENLESGARSTH